MDWVRLSFEGLFIAGVMLTQSGTLRMFMKGVARRMDLRRSLKRTRDPRFRTRNGKVGVHVDKVIVCSGMEHIWTSPAQFGAASVLLGCGAYLAAVWQTGWAFSLLPAVFCAGLPYLHLRVRLSKYRRARSHEGLVMIQELLAQYRIRGCSIREAAGAAADTLEDAPCMRGILYDLAKGLNQAYTEKECREELEKFRYSIGTTWGNALASSIFFSHVHGVCITHALEDLAGSLERSREVCEQSRREQHESRILLLFAVPGTYLWTVFCACRYFGMTLKKFLHYQFGTALGMRCFLISFMLFTAGLSCQVLLSGERLDIR